MVADNKALLAALREHFESKFFEQIKPDGLTNEEVGAIARAQYEGLKKVREVFSEIESCRSFDNSLSHINPAR